MLVIFERWNVVEMTELHIARHLILTFHIPLNTLSAISELILGSFPTLSV